MAVMALCVTANAGVPQGELFDLGWKFQLDAPQEAANPGFDDSSWRTLDLPHDWSIEAVPDRDAPAGNAGGFYPTGLGWYRKTFQYNITPGKKYLYFEGAYMNSEVYVNGQLAGGHPYGFTSFRVDITPFLEEGDNTIAVKVDNSAQPNCRWYSGSGIYRHVWLTDEPLIHFEHQGTFISTLEATPDRAVVRVQSKLVNEGIATFTGNVIIVLRREGKTVARVLVPVTSRPEQTIDICEDITIDSPSLWSPDSPALYETSLEGALDHAETRFGIRTIRWNSAEGFVLNGERILRNGSCIHSDNGILGAAAFDAAEYERAVHYLEKAKEVEEEDYVVLNHLAHSYRYLGDANRADENFRKIIETWPDSEWAAAASQYLGTTQAQEGTIPSENLVTVPAEGSV